MTKSNKIYFFGIVTAVLLILIYSFTDTGVDDAYEKKLREFRSEKDEFFATSNDSPIPDKDSFKKLTYFPPNQTYRIQASLEPISDTTRLKIRMTDGKTEFFVKYAYAQFQLEGKKHKLLLLKSSSTEEDEDQLFLPFTDETSGFDTYGGGRYLDVELKEEFKNQVMLDFNFAYNPFCAYNSNYSCPLPPAENNLTIAIKAGEKNYEKPAIEKKEARTK
jgi:hypothetical protein